MPVCISLNLRHLPTVMPMTNKISEGKIHWSNLTLRDLLTYSAQSDILLSEIELPKDVSFCSDVHLKKSHEWGRFMRHIFKHCRVITFFEHVTLSN